MPFKHLMLRAAAREKILSGATALAQRSRPFKILEMPIHGRDERRDAVAHLRDGLEDRRRPAIGVGIGRGLARLAHRIGRRQLDSVMRRRGRGATDAQPEH